MKEVSVVITDLDNTLYDWVDIWYKSFKAMLKKLVEDSGIPQQQLEHEIRSVFQKYGTSEYAFLIEELPSLQRIHPNEDLTKIYSAAIEEYRIARRQARKLYPTVSDTLIKLKKTGCIIVAYTESRAYYAQRRLQNLDLDGVIDYLYSPPNHAGPNKVWYGRNQLKDTKQCLTEEGELKPNPKILLEIIDGVRVNKEKTIYVGDNLMKDVYMAQEAGVTDVFAEYGISQYSEAYQQLRRVSHWKQSDVEKESAIYSRNDIKASYILKHNFQEILSFFKFVSYHP